MPINNSFMPNYNQPVYQNPIQSGVWTRFVNSEQEVIAAPNPITGCAFYILDGDKPVIYAKYADGRAMETYDMVFRDPPTAPEYLTVDSFNRLMDSKLDELSKKFVLRKERTNNGQ